jgi:predicted DNA-binding transcriptional regulator AlpA
MTTPDEAREAHPQHTFLRTSEVFARYRWGRSAGYLRLRDPNFPRPLPGGVYRLDTLLAWEESQLSGSSTSRNGTVEPTAADESVAPQSVTAPPARRRAKKAA